MNVWSKARWYLRVISGDTRYERHLADCRASGTVALSRRDFERLRSDHRDAHPEGRCC
ncbi:YbdD/YjiX family protein [Nocardioides sp.]|uniref:YbdD/YjiX family protein n=1 Tax=Nocardioides sp. TaxID=35761 RepID=UPI003D0CE3A8